MAASHSNSSAKSTTVIFEDLLQELHNICLKCEQHRTHYENICLEYRKLFKPWVKHSDNTKDKLQNENKSKTDSATQADVAPEEREKVVMANKILAKASRVRDFHIKKASVEGYIPQEETKTDKKPVQTSSAFVPPGCVSRASQENKSLQNSQTDKNSSRSTATVEKLPSNVAVSNPAVISQSHLNKLLSKGEQKQVLNDRKVSSKQRYMPASARAPFKTETPVIQSKRPFSGNSGKKVMATKTRENSSVTRNITTKSKEKSREARSQPGSQNLDQNTAGGKMLTNHTSENISAHERVAEYLVSVNSAQEMSSMVTAVHNMNLESSAQGTSLDYAKEAADEKQQPSQPSPQQPEGEHQQVFDIIKHGTQIEIPVRLKQLVGKNRRLKQKLQSSRLTKQVQQAQTAKESFLEKLQQHKKTAAPEFINTIQLTAVYVHLHKLLNKLDAGTLNEDSNWCHVLRHKRVLEYVFSSFASLEEHCKKLTKGHEMVEKSSVHVQLKRPNIQGPEIWLPSSISMLPDLRTRKQCKYKKVKAMQRYYTLVHEYQLLKLQQSIMDMAAREALPLLEATQPYDREMIELYRCMYSLLTTFGRGFPTLIADLDEDSEEDQHDF